MRTQPNPSFFLTDQMYQPIQPNKYYIFVFVVAQYYRVVQLLFIKLNSNSILLIAQDQALFPMNGSKTRGIYFHRKLKLFRDALKNLQNFSKIIIKFFRNYGWKLMFLSIFSCFCLNTHFLHEKSVNFLKKSSKLFRKFAKFQNFSVMIITT